MRDFGKDILYCLGYGENEPDGRTAELIEKIKNEAVSALTPKAVHGTFTVESLGFSGNDIKEHLNGAEMYSFPRHSRCGK